MPLSKNSAGPRWHRISTGDQTLYILILIRSTSPRGDRGTGCCFGLADLSENRRDDGGEPSLRQPQAARFTANKPRGAKRMAPLTGGRALFDWIAMIDPVGSEIGGKVQRFDIGEAHLLEECDSRTHIGAAVKRA